MARRRSSADAVVDDRRVEAREIIDWYKDRLRSGPVPEWPFDPVRVGPTWQWDENGFVLPEWSGGWDVLAWCGLWLKNEDGKPWLFTMEQARFILWWHEVDPGTLRWVNNNAALQRLKGWGKDPLAAAIALCYLVGPSIPDRLGVDGEVRLRPNPAAWVQVFAVSEAQTQNTMSLFRSLLTAEARLRYGIIPLRRTVWALGDTVQIQAATSSPDSVEGNRPSLVIRNETQNWKKSNGGHALAGVISGNASKAKKHRPARTLDIFNAYREGEDSIAQRTREGWLATQEGASDTGPVARDFGLLYDSLEAPDDARLSADAISDVVNVVRGDAVWLDTEPGGTVAKDILDPRNPPSESRRKWYNQIQSVEEAWTTAQLWDSNVADVVVEPGEQIAVFLDCSKSDDGTALVCARISDGYRWVAGYWQRPPGERGKGWIVSREAVDVEVRKLFRDYAVVGFFVDPSHAKEDETFQGYWDVVVDQWHRDFGKRLRVWVKRGRAGHSCNFDMSELANQKAFTAQVALCEQEIADQELPHSADVRLRTHVLNARRIPTRAGLSIGKESRGSKRKVDLAVAMVGAGLVRRMFLNDTSKRGGRIW